MWHGVLNGRAWTPTAISSVFEIVWIKIVQIWEVGGLTDSHAADVLVWKEKMFNCSADTVGGGGDFGGKN